MAGSWTSGSTVATHRPVSETSIASPDAEHRHRGEHAADHDKQRGDGSPPADPPSATCASLLTVELGCLGSEAFELGSLIRGEPFMRVARVARVAPVPAARVGGRWRTACIRQAHVAVTSAVPAVERRFHCCGSYRWICWALRASSASGLAWTRLTLGG